VKFIDLLAECFAHFVPKDAGRFFNAGLDQKTRFVDITESKLWVTEKAKTVPTVKPCFRIIREGGEELGELDYF
jgi:hypothetical protein